jgi:hypothetical protein
MEKIRKNSTELLILFVYLLCVLPTIWLLFFSTYSIFVADFLYLGIHILVDILLIKESQRLADYKIDRFAIGFFLVSQFIQGFMAYSALVALAFWTLAIFTYIKVKSNFSIPGFSWKRSLNITIFGIFIIFLVRVSNAFQLNYQQLLATTLTNISWENILIRSFFYFWYGAIEELYFRGFFWRAAQKRCLSENQIWIFTSVLMFIPHLPNLQNVDPGQFWTFIPVLILLLGYLRKKTGILTPGIIVHAFANGIWNIMILIFVFI